MLDGLHLCRLVHRNRFGFEFGLCRRSAEDAIQGIDTVLDVVAKLESRDHTFFDLDRLAGARVACRACLAGLAGERSESADLDGIAFDELFADEVEELLYDNAFNLESYIIEQFGKALSNAEEDAFLSME